jgi:hypothetical protein
MECFYYWNKPPWLIGTGCKRASPVQNGLIRMEWKPLALNKHNRHLEIRAHDKPTG